MGVNLMRVFMFTLVAPLNLRIVRRVEHTDEAVVKSVVLLVVRVEVFQVPDDELFERNLAASIRVRFLEPALDSVLGDIRRVLDAKELRHHLRELAVVDGVAAVDVEVLKTATDLVDDGDGDAVLLGDARDELVVRGSLLLVDDAEEVL